MSLTPIDQTWETIIRSRNPYYFIFNWNYQLLIMIAVIFLFIIVLSERKYIFKNNLKSIYAHLLFLIPLFFLIVYFLTVELLKIPFFLQLQLLRSLALFKIFGIIFFSFFAYNHIKREPNDVLSNFFLIGIVSSFLFERWFIFPLPSKDGLLILYLIPYLYIWFNKKYKFSFNYLIFIITLAFSFYLSRILSIRIALLVPNIFLIATLTFLIKYQTKVIKKHHYLMIKALVLILALILIISFPKFKITPYYFEDKSFLDVCDWVIKNTSMDAVFITEPFTTKNGPLRISCKRNSFTSFKDGTFALYDQNFAMEWKERMNLVNAIVHDYSLLPEISRKYKLDYLLSDRKLEINYPKVYANAKYSIYMLRHL